MHKSTHDPDGACNPPLCRMLGLLVILLSTAGLTAQIPGLAGSKNVPMRITGTPHIPLLGGPQHPPYSNMAIFLSNAFQTPSDDMVMVRDSSVCSEGIPGTSDFAPLLVAEYTHDDGVLTGIVFWQVDGTGERTMFSRKDFTFQEGKLVEYLYRRWNENDQMWDNHSLEILTYDGEGRITSNALQTWSGDAWVPSTRRTISYLPERVIGEILYEEWDNGQWVAAHRTTASYNANRLPETVVEEEPAGAVWDTIALEMYSYDDVFAFILEGYSLRERDSTSGILQPVLREAYDYDLRGFFTERLLQTWDATAQEWQHVLRDQYAFTPIGIWRSWSRQIWDGDWQNMFSREFKLNNGLQVDIQQNWDTMSGAWVNAWRRFVNFNDYGNLTWERNAETWHANNAEWVNGAATDQCRHFWSEEMTSSTSFAQANLADCLMMNPYLLESEIRCLSLDAGTEYNAHVYDQMGRLIYHRTFAGNQSFSLQAGIPAGMYYLLVSDRSHIRYQRKLVIQD
ncbi:MAG: T9SS type A sorting domain-containing protein [Saprospiraceae bacterium]|nr:T9SS type A sorting domain-containing protein [Saprospiraceae bacterium]